MVEAEPNRSDYYLMQIAMEVRRVLSRNPNRIKLKHFKLTTDNKGGKAQVDYKKLAPYSIASWRGAIMGAWKKMTEAVKPPVEPAKPPPEPKPIPQRNRRGARNGSKRK